MSGSPQRNPEPKPAIASPEKVALANVDTRPAQQDFYPMLDVPYAGESLPSGHGFYS